MANRNWASSGKIYSMRAGPVMIDCNFIVDSSNVNGLGIRELKGPCVHAVYMHTSATPSSLNPNPQGMVTPGGLPAGSPVLGLISTYGIFANSAITNSVGTSIVNGDLGESPGSTVTGAFTVSGSTNLGNGASLAARTDAIAAYTDLSTRSSTTIPSALDGQTLTAGVYSFASGAATLAASGNGTLTFSGSATDVFVIITASTLGTGAGGIPTIAFTGGALPENVYWAVGSSATINIGVTSAGSVFPGSIFASASITVTQSSTINGRLIAGMGATGAVTVSNISTITAPSVPPPINLGSCAIIVQLEDNYNRYTSMFKSIISPTSGSALKIDNSALTAGVSYIISTVGSSTEAQWHALGLPAGVTPAVGVSFVANSVGAGANSSTSRVMASAAAGSGICTIEMIGDPDKSIAPDPTKNQGWGAQFILCCRNYQGAEAAPADGTLISLSFLLDNSSVRFQRE